MNNITLDDIRRHGVYLHKNYAHQLAALAQQMHSVYDKRTLPEEVRCHFDEFTDVLERYFPGMFIITDYDVSEIHFAIDERIFIDNNYRISITLYNGFLKLEPPVVTPLYFNDSPISESEYSINIIYMDAYMSVMANRDFWKDAYEPLKTFFVKYHNSRYTRTCGYLSANPYRVVWPEDYDDSIIK